MAEVQRPQQHAASDPADCNGHDALIAARRTAVWTLSDVVKSWIACAVAQHVGACRQRCTVADVNAGADCELALFEFCALCAGFRPSRGEREDGEGCC